MSIQSCSCTAPAFGNLGRPNCVIEMKAIAFPIIVPRFKADGTRNTIDLSSPTLGADIQALIPATVDAQSRIYPFPRCENITFERSDTVYETAPSTRKYKIDGVGGVRTFNFELWAKDAVHTMQRELNKYGCSDVDFYLVDVAGSLWGIKDNLDDTIIRGYEMATETFDSFKEYASDTSVGKIMFSWDMDNGEVEACSFAITSGELGYKATTLTANISGFQTVTPVSNTTFTDVVYTGFGSAGDRDDITGLVDTDFAVANIDTPAAVAVVSAVEAPDGTYLVTTAAQTAGETHSVTITIAGYDVEVATFVAIA